MDFYDFFQNLRISESKDSAAKAHAAAGTNQRNIADLQDQIDQLSLVCMAMCELLEEVGFNKNMLVSKIREIDLRDGKLDGKLAQSNVCGSCNREQATRHVRCLYCGSSLKYKMGG